MDYNIVPKNIKWHISSYLYGWDFLNYLSTDKRIRESFNNEEFWKYIIIRQFPNIVNKKPSYLTYKLFYKRLYYQSGPLHYNQYKLSDYGYKLTDYSGDEFIDAFDDSYKIETCKRKQNPDGSVKITVNFDNPIKPHLIKQDEKVLYEHIISMFKNFLQYRVVLLADGQLFIHPFIRNGEPTMFHHIYNVKDIIYVPDRFYYLTYNEELYYISKEEPSLPPVLVEIGINKISSYNYNNIMYIKSHALYRLYVPDHTLYCLFEKDVVDCGEILDTGDICVKYRDIKNWYIYKNNNMTPVNITDDNIVRTLSYHYRVPKDCLQEIKSTRKVVQIKKRY